ncbi:MAG: hypothetical protein PHU24_09535 [Sphaerochaetaceae bacterium]|nr:hypothetical protein [Sphaerochaetaceae bacterium]NLO60982.1 hypothetical protein [Spirochaetales bacterium]MDD2406686.1 hypothetical protein [Sphaerochaetaceae bacterium]MDD3671476.1 hypothetical protein [Sphaerochaetaceae bacterium]MDD4259239.1 hypothetical protein [Sphaerochaetaceae bacterium]
MAIVSTIFCGNATIDKHIESSQERVWPQDEDSSHMLRFGCTHQAHGPTMTFDPIRQIV